MLCTEFDHKQKLTIYFSLNKNQPQQFKVKATPKMLSEDYIMRERMKMQDGTWLR